MTFVNRDHTAHTATSADSGFDSGTLHPGQHKTLAFNKPGTYTYYCQFHPFMRAVITVKPKN